MNVCFVCETPFHIFNCLNFVLNQEDIRFLSIDLYLCDKIQKIDQIASTLEDHNIFSNIYRYSYSAEDNSTYIKAIRYISPKNYFISLISSYENSYIFRKYDAIYYASLTRFVRAFIISHPSIETYMYDDGAGSYSGKSGLSFVSAYEKLAYWLHCSSYKKFYPKALYVNNVSICKTEWTSNIRPLPSFKNASKETIDLLSELFGDIPSLYFESMLVYLSQPYDGYDEVEADNANQLRQLLQRYSFIYRPHPREQRHLINGSFCDDSGVLWEMICAKVITDEHVLIARCSTAQVAPKWFFNKEPYIIFTYRTANDLYTKRFQDTYDDIYIKTRTLYSNPEKVISINSMDELILTIQKLKYHAGDID